MKSKNQVKEIIENTKVKVRYYYDEHVARFGITEKDGQEIVSVVRLEQMIDKIKVGTKITIEIVENGFIISTSKGKIIEKAENIHDGKAFKVPYNFSTSIERLLTEPFVLKIETDEIDETAMDEILETQSVKDKLFELNTMYAATKNKV